MIGKVPFLAEPGAHVRFAPNSDRESRHWSIRGRVLIVGTLHVPHGWHSDL
jgi:hypothetical protein